MLCSLMLMAALVAVRWRGSVVSWVRVKAASHSVCTEAPSRHLQYSTVQYSSVQYSTVQRAPGGHQQGHAPALPGGQVGCGVQQPRDQDHPPPPPHVGHRAYRGVFRLSWS